MSQRIVVIVAWLAQHRVPGSARLLDAMEERGFGTFGSN